MGQHLAIVGESGSGKTTLLKIIAGLLDADDGEATFLGKKITGPLYNLLPGHKGIAYLSQHFELRNNYIVADYLDYGNTLKAMETEALLSACGITHLLSRKTNSGLSGGEKQRIALAKLLLTQPKLLLLDEPFTNLDYEHKKVLEETLRRLESGFGISYLMVSHDPRDLMPWADKVIVLHNGSIIQIGKPHEVFYQPTDTYTAALFGPYNVLNSADALLLGLPKTDTLAENVILRPSLLSMDADGPEALKAVITAISFMGHYYAYSLLWRNKAIQAFALIRQFAPGETVFLRATTPPAEML